MSRKIIRFAMVAVGLAGALGVGMAQAREADVQWSVTIGTPLFIQAPLPYARTLPYPSYSRPVPVYEQPVPRHAYRTRVQPTRWDRDGDGIPNRQDRLYNPVWDRDGDGIPNRYDRFDDRRQGRRGDGIPDRRDGNDGQGWRGR